ncbi:2-desacetyl-2-hydroxyethyl bacteriochlorophyllide A dehydrogenase [Caldalkalibacillus uzonensis]|uniref:2-desacetyl-2-hydroxyethyl bacteriochlorophyllide A dehydrogenase n=1 Tax=Caldalkalibacillus uzonensis TaxID=353224 RepID=A0ABU0CQZ7_9BACI|nr:zinc-binding alcohol dehydrogenase [Caldalkalibacillus uzonensis]MDQ0338562.1 2-desacetyl-2-hydroxyethyl bacteriochlorophyllide A dehydrogenase [Caldalkalibacillus uzonensis]
MKVVTSLDGEIKIMDLPPPVIKDNHVIVKTEYSAVSPGTELMLLRKKHQVPMPLGYSASGLVIETGRNVDHVRIGERVACYGGPYVKHAEYLLVPKNLVVSVPDGVDMKEASMIGLGAIAIHALRQAGLKFGESVVVVGLGILGQLIAQIAHCAAFKVIGYDLLEERCQKLKDCGIDAVGQTLEEVQELVNIKTQHMGVDSVLLCTNGNSEGLIDHALTWIRDRGNVVIVGDLKPVFSRTQMFRKEAEILISRAAGPGRYDPDYETKGFDYPPSFVRWSEGRNMQEYIRLLAEKRINVASLVTHTVSINQLSHIYRSLMDQPQNMLGVLIDFGLTH